MSRSIPDAGLLYEATERGLELRPERRTESPRLATAVDLGPLFEELSRE